MHVGKGYNLGIEFKHYLNKRFFGVANFHCGKNDGSEYVSYAHDGMNFGFTMGNSCTDYMLGLGLGADLLQLNRHKVYLQATAGLGMSESAKDVITGSPHDYVKTLEEQTNRFAISWSAGYDYRVNRWLAVGVNYTGYQIGYEYKNAANAKLTLLF